MTENFPPIFPKRSEKTSANGAVSRPPSRKELQNTLQETFGLERLRPEQQKVIDSVLHGADTLAIMPTGSGKSLCYQLPSVKMPGTTVVVSPLISLMKDQVEKLEAAGIEAEQFNSTLNRQEEEDALRNLERAATEFVFVTPERLSDPDFITTLRRNPIDLFVIDEAHCISRWGHDFRPAFLGLKGAIEALGNPTVLALTATATEPVIEDIMKQLGRPDMHVINAGIYRPNLRFAVIQATSEVEKISETIRLARSYQGSGIIYTATVKAVEQIHQALLQAGESADLYHGQLTAEERKLSQDRFMGDETRIMVATNAFGMGIDKRDIRFVIHFQIPANLEAYYQEAGRAGRDNEAADCTLLYYLQDKRIQQFFLARRYPDAEDVEAVHETLQELGAETTPASLHAIQDAVGDMSAARLQVALKLLLDAGFLRQDKDLRYSLVGVQPEPSDLTELGNSYRDRNEHARSAFERMVFYAQTGFCRWQVMLEYFDEKADFERCGTCDNCLRPPEEELAEPARGRDARRPAAHEGSAANGELREGLMAQVPKLGTGQIVGIVGEKITISFPNGETRTFLADYVKPADSPR